VLLAGSIIAESDRDIINLIEEQAVIVADVVCTGARFIAEDIHPGADPLNVLACYYFNRIPCACRRPNDRLFQHIQQLIIERGVQGIVYQTLLYCDPWRFEARQLRVQTQLPMLEIDHDYSRQNYEQLRTRIEAFIELLRAKNK
jgi:benzoyl-CoA reductase/2-hydroxyglutaryl-CoA dehydratase subunit BcrC/BadD/HgdB